MKTTYFKPSIHGWPFRNSFTYSQALGFIAITLDMGFCGGMCWTALERFYAGVSIPRDTQCPAQGDALYNEIYSEQIASLMGPPTFPGAKLLEIYNWQQSPDMYSWSNIHDSLGIKTQRQWPNIKQLLDSSKPVTLTLIANSNDYDPGDLIENHRVVAYAYHERPLHDGEWVHGDRNPSIRHVTISIYDPNYPNSDDVSLRFFTNCDDEWIGLRHSKGDEFHGFFLDDKDRSYASADSTSVWINSCVQTGISSATRADYDLRFSWRCRFIPYFCVRVNGINWQYNAAAKAGYPPAYKDHKQCLARTGSETVKLKLPRGLSRVDVRLLDSDDYSHSVNVDASPAIDCYPYVHSRGAGVFSDAPYVYDTAITDVDLFIKDPNPTQAAVQQVDTSPFRWIVVWRREVIDLREPRHDDLSRAAIFVKDSYRLGNITVPILADFVERNLAAPTQTSGVVTIKRHRQAAQTTTLTTLAIQGQKIFDGFTGNPADYDEDTIVEFTYRSEDRFHVVAQGKAEFYGRSIIWEQVQVAIEVLEPDKIAALAAVAQKLIEQGLIGIAIELPRRGPRPTPDPLVLLQRLRSHHELQSVIDRSLKALWGNPDIWKEVWEKQSEILKKEDKGIVLGMTVKVGDALKTANELKEAEQRKYDSVVIDTFAEKAIEQVRRNPTVIRQLKSLM